jgi:hypothetical protein
MIEKLSRRSKSFPARRAIGHHYTSTALRDGRRFVDEVAEVVAMEFRSWRATLT